MQAGSIQPSPPRIQWIVIERQIDNIRNAFTAQRPILNMTRELKDLLEPPWTSIFSIRAKCAIYRRIREANQQIAEKLEIRKRTGPEPDTAKLGTNWIKLVPTGVEIIGIAESFGGDNWVWCTEIPRSTFDQVILVAKTAFHDSLPMRSLQRSIESNPLYHDWHRLDVQSQRALVLFTYGRANEAGQVRMKMKRATAEFHGQYLPTLKDYEDKIVWKATRISSERIRWETMKALLDSIRRYFQDHQHIKTRFEEMQTLVKPAWTRLSPAAQNAIYDRFELSSRLIRERHHAWMFAPREVNATTQSWGDWLDLMPSGWECIKMVEAIPGERKWSTSIPRLTLDYALVQLRIVHNNSPTFRTWRDEVFKPSEYYQDFSHLVPDSQQRILELLYDKADEFAKLEGLREENEHPSKRRKRPKVLNYLPTLPNFKKSVEQTAPIAVPDFSAASAAPALTFDFNSSPNVPRRRLSQERVHPFADWPSSSIAMAHPVTANLVTQFGYSQVPQFGFSPVPQVPAFDNRFLLNGSSPSNYPQSSFVAPHTIPPGHGFTYAHEAHSNFDSVPHYE